MSGCKLYLTALIWVALSCVGLRAQSGITAQNGRQAACASDDGKRHLCQVTTQYGVRMVKPAQRLAVHPGTNLGIQPTMASGSTGAAALTSGLVMAITAGTRAEVIRAAVAAATRKRWPERSPAPPTTANETTATQTPAAVSDWSTSGADRHAPRDRPGATTGPKSGWIAAVEQTSRSASKPRFFSRTMEYDRLVRAPCPARQGRRGFTPLLR